MCVFSDKERPKRRFNGLVSFISSHITHLPYLNCPNTEFGFGQETVSSAKLEVASKEIKLRVEAGRKSKRREMAVIIKQNEITQLQLGMGLASKHGQDFLKCTLMITGALS